LTREGGRSAGTRGGARRDIRTREIADRRFVSLPTVKRHVANAYGELGVGHRTEAIARANELNVL
jgi:ATP/maltotriose-dependent transcriptional regulator MalT